MNWRDAPSLSALRGFEAAARLGSLSQAAAELNVTHAAIAQHVRTMEGFLGEPLLVRQGRGMTMTPAGAVLQPELTAGFARILDAVSDLTRRKEDGPLRVTTTPSFAEHWLMPRLVRFWKDHPDIAIFVASSYDVTDLRRDGFDVALRYGRGDWRGVDAQLLVAVDYIVAATPELADIALDKQTWLLNTQHGEAAKWANAQGFDRASLITREIGDTGMVLAATRAGAGVSVQSRALIATDIAAGTLVSVYEAAPEPNVGYHIVTRPELISPRLRTFTKWLTAST